VYETELEEKWSEHPLDLLLLVHTDGKKIHRRSVALFRKDILRCQELNVMKIEKEKQGFQTEGSRNKAFRLTSLEKKEED
jgi:hypothetical protein